MTRRVRLRVFVTTTTDDLANNGNCSLREATHAANIHT
jgi:CSLREA domain-containing protein